MFTQTTSSEKRLSGSPAIRINLLRFFFPWIKLKLCMLTPQVFVSNLKSSLLAIPFSGATVTETFSTTAPLSSRIRPLTRFCLAFGMRRMAATTPSDVLVNGRRRSDKTHVEIGDDAAHED